MFLVDKASDDGSGIWCSKGTIQRHTELGESTVKRTSSDFLREGILIATGRRPCKNGFTVIYRIVLTRVMALESAADKRVEKSWAAYPKNRQRGKAASVTAIAEALAEGIDPVDLQRAVQTYATESAGFTRSKVCFSDNWFAGRRWQRFLGVAAEEREARTTLAADHHERLAAWVRARSPVCKQITGPQVTALVAAGLVIDSQLRAAGLAG